MLNPSRFELQKRARAARWSRKWSDLDAKKNRTSRRLERRVASIETEVEALIKKAVVDIKEIRGLAENEAKLMENLFLAAVKSIEAK